MASSSLSPAALSPSVFSIVLGTGGVSLCANLLGLRKVALALLALNALLLAIAWIATVLRVAWTARALLADLTDLTRGPSFFFAPLATGIFGIQIAVLTDAQNLVQPCWIFSLVLWLLLSCLFMVGASVREGQAGFAEAISPTWLLPGAALIVTVGLGTHVMREAGETLLFGLYGGLLLGFFFNVVVMVALLYRWLFLPMRPEQLLANNWINMGGFAIVVVAGLKLAALHGRSVPAGATAWSEIPIRPLVIFSWVVATWWVPILLAAGFWRHALQRVPFRYETPYWALVFSPSVYALATAGLIAEHNLVALMWVPPAFAVFASIAWVALMVSFVRSLLRA